MTTNLYPGNWFKITGRGWYYPEPFVDLPENFTLQFDLMMTEDPENSSNSFSTGVYIVDADYKDPDEGGAIPGKAGIKIYFGQWDHSYSNYSDGNYNISGDKSIEQLHFDEPAKISMCGQKTRLRIYVNDVKVFDVPKALPAGHVYNQLRFIPEQGWPMITNLRVAAGAPDMRNKLLTEGKLVTHGILFDVNSDKIKPESYGTLKEISKVLQDNPTVRVKIVGHTDSDGPDAANLDLSKKRSESVKSALKTEFGIDEARMETDGKGETEAISDNNTPAGKANNRRVEFIKL
jgi:outer membrane protein OmpA-like peptidoglycan-associated protein